MSSNHFLRVHMCFLVSNSLACWHPDGIQMRNQQVLRCVQRRGEPIRYLRTRIGISNSPYEEGEEAFMAHNTVGPNSDTFIKKVHHFRNSKT